MFKWLTRFLPFHSPQTKYGKAQFVTVEENGAFMRGVFGITEHRNIKCPTCGKLLVKNHSRTYGCYEYEGFSCNQCGGSYGTNYYVDMTNGYVYTDDEMRQRYDAPDEDEQSKLRKPAKKAAKTSITPRRGLAVKSTFWNWLFHRSQADNPSPRIAAKRKAYPKPEPPTGTSEKSKHKTTSRSVATTCPSCKKKLKVSSDVLGKKAKCPACDKIFSIRDQATKQSVPKTHSSDSEELIFRCPKCFSNNTTNAGSAPDAFSCTLCRASILIPRIIPKLTDRIYGTFAGVSGSQLRTLIANVQFVLQQVRPGDHRMFEEGCLSASPLTGLGDLGKASSEIVSIIATKAEATEECKSLRLVHDVILGVTSVDIQCDLLDGWNIDFVRIALMARGDFLFPPVFLYVVRNENGYAYKADRAYFLTESDCYRLGGQL